MYLLTLRDKKDEGAYAVDDGYGDKVLFLFEQEDDAERYAMMLELEKDGGDKEMDGFFVRAPYIQNSLILMWIPQTSSKDFMKMNLLWI